MTATAILTLLALALNVAGTQAQVIPDLCRSVYKQACADIAQQLPPTESPWNAFLLMCSTEVTVGNPRPRLNGFCGFCPASTNISNSTAFWSQTPPSTCRIAAARSLAGTVFYRFGPTNTDTQAFNAAMTACTNAACPPTLSPWSVSNNSTTVLVGHCSCASATTGEFLAAMAPPFVVPEGFVRAELYNVSVVVPTVPWPSTTATPTTSATATASTVSTTKTSGAGGASKGMVVGVAVAGLMALIFA
ncbi:hypothetical protein HDU96_006374 [Phlyctochytrium bullatum]|nr:hypothetical protein HDU96_006374 [Phlyctochytrium bullatum]